jgi:ribosomal protein L34E
MKVEKVACDVCKTVFESTDPMLKVVIHLKKPELSTHSSAKADMDVCPKCGDKLAGVLRLEPALLT